MHLVTVTRDHAPGHLKAHQAAAEPLRFQFEQRIASNKIVFIQLGDPAQPRLQRRGTLIDIIAIETVFFLQAQGVACPQADRSDVKFLPGGKDLLPDRPGMLAVKVQFKSRFPGIAGRGDNHLHPGEHAFAKPVKLNLREIHVGEFLEGGFRLFPLHRQLGDAVADVLYRHPFQAIFPDPGFILIEVGGVDHQQVVIAAIVDDQVVDDPTIGIAHRAVLGLVDGDLGGVIDGEAVDHLQGPGAAQDDLPHVRHIEDAHGGAHPPVLLQDAAVLDRHLKAGKIDHLGAQAHVFLVETGFLGFHNVSFRFKSSRKIIRLRKQEIQ